MQQLKLPETGSVEAAYSVTVVTGNVLTINVGAPSSAAAVQRASAVATTFLQYRAQFARTQLQLLSAQLDQQFNALSAASRCLMRKPTRYPSCSRRLRRRSNTTACRPRLRGSSRSFST